jgi:hypothetical protein
MLAEYGAFCQWSDNLLTQLEENKKQKQEYSSSIYSPSLFSSATKLSNRDFENDEYDDYDIYEFVGSKYAESYVRRLFRIDDTIPMKM